MKHAHEIPERVEQMGVHLQDLGRSSPEAVRVRSELYAMLQQLAELKAECERRKALLECTGELLSLRRARLL